MKYAMILIGAIFLFGCGPAETSGPPATTSCQEDSARKQPIIDTLREQVTEWKKGVKYEDYVKSRAAVRENIDLKDDKDKLDKDKARLADDQAKVSADQKKLDDDRKKEGRKERTVEEDKERMAADKANMERDRKHLHEDDAKTGQKKK